MKEKLWQLIATTGIIGLAVIFIIILWSILELYSLIIVLPITIILEIYVLSKIDNYFIIQKKKKLFEMGIISDIDKRSIKEEDVDLFEKYRNIVNNSINFLNDILISMDDVYTESLFLIEDGEILKGKKIFKSTLNKAKSDIENEDIKIIQITNEMIEKADPPLKISIKNYKEYWDKNRIDILRKIKEIAEKFKLRSEIEDQIEKIFKFEIEKKQVITEEDASELGIPPDQFKRLLRMIEKPVKVDINKLSEDEKQRLGSASKKIISLCMKNNITPNLPYLHYVLKIDLKTAKEILSYLKNIGMIDLIFYHIV
ncbi:MAG: hypothetical protein ACTSRP_14575 [Candidatus Helarchaeota archaeon]